MLGTWALAALMLGTWALAVTQDQVPGQGPVTSDKALLLAEDEQGLRWRCSGCRRSRSRHSFLFVAEGHSQHCLLYTSDAADE